MESLKTHRKKTILGVLLFLVIFLIWWTWPSFDSSGTIKIWDRNGVLLYESAGSTGKKIPVTYDRLPKHLIDAAVASEDETFWTNPGIDIMAIGRSAFLDLQAKSIVSGASTITQQLARASIISPNSIPRQDIIRKIREIIIALRITAGYSKKDIITAYFNRMYFGNLSYGIEAAARTYFNTNTQNLSLAQSALLVGLLSSPDAGNP
ncbi:MAG: transglycosylase domain-containing protein, partial [Candidatus Levyibacteriota bacterium]